MSESRTLMSVNKFRWFPYRHMRIGAHTGARTSAHKPVFFIYNFYCCVILLPNPLSFHSPMQKSHIMKLYSIDDSLLNVKICSDLENHFLAVYTNRFCSCIANPSCLQLVHLDDNERLENVDWNTFLVFCIWNKYIITAYQESCKNYDDFCLVLCCIVQHAFNLFFHIF